VAEGIVVDASGVEGISGIGNISEALCPRSTVKNFVPFWRMLLMVSQLELDKKKQALKLS
jgi:hypothetical protein